MSHNTHIHKIARLTVQPFLGSRLTPNHVTSVRLTAGLAAAACLAVGAGAWPAVGAGIFVVSVVLDRADGELARLTNNMTRRGHLYDLIADAVCNAAILFGLGIGLRAGSLGLWSVPLGLLAGLAVAAILWMVLRIEALGGHRAAELPGFAGFDVDDLVLLIPVGVWLGWSEPMLIAAAVIAPVVALIFAVMLVRRLRGTKAAKSPETP